MDYITNAELKNLSFDELLAYAQHINTLANEQQDEISGLEDDINELKDAIDDLQREYSLVVDERDTYLGYLSQDEDQE